MSIKVMIHPYLHQFTGGQDLVESTGHNVSECLDHLEAQFPGIKGQLGEKRGGSFKLFDYIDIYVNGRSAYPEELAKPLQDGDEVAIVVMMIGG